MNGLWACAGRHHDAQPLNGLQQLTAAAVTHMNIFPALDKSWFWVEKGA